MIAKKCFNPGDIILEEEALVSCQYSWNREYGYLACDHCMRPLETIQENIHRLANDPTLQVPLQQHDPTKHWIENFTFCPRCNIRYCSEDCLREAYAKYHRAGCLKVDRNNENHPVNVLNSIWK